MAQRPGGGPPRFEPPRPGARRATLRALGYLREHRRDAGGALLALLLVSAANLAIPQLIGVAIDTGIDDRRANVVVVAVAGLVGAALARGLFTFLQGYLAERASQGVAYDLREALFAKLERLSFAYYDRIETGQLITRLTNDVEQIRLFAGTGVIQLISATLMIVGTTTLLLALNWRLALVVFAIVPIVLALLLRFITRIGPLFGQTQQALGDLNALLQEDLVGLRAIRAFGRERDEAARYAAANDALLERNLLTTRVFANNFPLVFLTANLGTLSILWFGGRQVIGGSLSVGQLVAFNTYLGFLLMPLLTIGFQMAGISRAGASALRVFEVLDEPVDVQDAPGATPLPPLSGRVEFDSVGFRYPGDQRDVLTDITFIAEPGQLIAILGTTGSGKSSLVHLLPRFYDVTAGAVRVDSHDVRSVTLASLRGQIGIVLQDMLLFSGSVHDNIAFGKPDATRVDVERAAHAAQADGFIRALPDGYDTLIGERGVGLSGGQRQRVAIARALLIDPRLLILDDSTSAVDSNTEAAIREAIDRLARDHRRTAFVVAQRISTARDADLILVLDGGRIAARGTHAELLRDSELYNDIVRSQLIDDTAGVAVVAAGASAAGSHRVGA